MTTTLLVLGGGGGGLGARFDHANHGNVSGRRNPIQSQSRRGIAGDHQHLRAMRFQKVRGFDRIAGDCFDGFRAVGKARGVAKVGVIGVGNKFK